MLLYGIGRPQEHDDGTFTFHNAFKVLILGGQLANERRRYNSQGDHQK